MGACRIEQGTVETRGPNWSLRATCQPTLTILLVHLDLSLTSKVKWVEEVQTLSCIFEELKIIDIHNHTQVDDCQWATATQWPIFSICILSKDQEYTDA